MEKKKVTSDQSVLFDPKNGHWRGGEVNIFIFILIKFDFFKLKFFFENNEIDSCSCFTSNSYKRINNRWCQWFGMMNYYYFIVNKQIKINFFLFLFDFCLVGKNSKYDAKSIRWN